MDWTGSYVGALVVDVGHSNIRGGHAGEQYPCQVWSSSIGVCDNYEVFPLVSNSRCNVSTVDHLKNVDPSSGETFINTDPYLRALRGTFGGRTFEKIMSSHVSCAAEKVDLGDIPLLMGVFGNEHDCWDEFNTYTISRVPLDRISNPYSLTESAILNEVPSLTSVSSGLGEINGLRPLFIIDGKYNRQNRILQTEMIFEELGVPGLYFGDSSRCSAYASGFLTGLVIDIGSATCSVAAIIDDQVLGFKECNVGGDIIDAIFLNLLLKATPDNKTYVLNHPEYNLGDLKLEEIDAEACKSIAQRIYNTGMEYSMYSLHQKLKALKESIIRVSQTPLLLQGYTEPNHLPDGQPLEYSMMDTRGRSRNTSVYVPPKDATHVKYDSLTPFQLLALSAEVIFNPTIEYAPPGVSLGKFKGIIAHCEDVVRESGIYRRDIFNQIALVGGAALSNGLQERLAQEFQRVSKTPQDTPLSGCKFKFTAYETDACKEHASWIGGSIIASLGSFHDCWISRAEYNEHGPNIANRKVF
ncbi:hypothetical protein BEWA_032640 [Theileria equi strain WA]|uniref:Actin n=1 Tax=Theileria equi strain WA TaxID=1537102 RepID=L0AZJ6_THEEQ|nr:hypothetical protein BEWA_032640 [Theileria equi strain WA]AFZ80411.1 hypothetical protein BEWA_032640 [Theileria equi strain WA]|eukprot:XP_004830077.1 hypothetical protein BEWA_032640 [Theileria equi strain WA]